MKRDTKTGEWQERTFHCELIGIALGLGALGSIASAAIGGSAAESAAATQASAANTASANQLKMFNEIKASLAPFLQFGQSAIPMLSGALPSLTKPFTGADLANTPWYQFTLDQGLKAAQNSFAAQGLSKSGPAIKGAINYAEGLAGTTYNSVFANQLAQKNQIAAILSSVIGGGQNAAAQQGGFGTAATTSANQFLTSGAAASAAGTIGAANAANAGIAGLGNNAFLYALLKGSSTAGGAGAYPSAAVNTAIGNRYGLFPGTTPS